MNQLLRIAIAIVIGVLVTSILEWLTAAPRTVDVLAGIVAAFLAYRSLPGDRVI